MTHYLVEAYTSTFKNIILSFFLGLIFFLVCVVTASAQTHPPSALTQTQTQTQTQTKSVSELEKMIQDLMSQVALLKRDVSHGGSNASSSPSRVCPDWKHTLKNGSSDAYTNGEVSKLQNFLTTTGDYTHGRVTGTYGSATEAAVQRWQHSNGIVVSGTPSSTGYGVVGQMTREKMKAKCVPQIKSYTLTDVASVTKKVVDPIPLAIDDEYTLYTVTLKTGVVHTFKKGFMAPGTFEKEVKATGYTGDIPALLALATNTPGTPVAPTAYGLTDVASVKVDSSKTLFDGPAVYTITLKSGAKVVVSVCVSRGCTDTNRDAAFKDSGYTGDVTKLIALAKKARVCTNARVTYQEGDIRTSSSTFSSNKYLSSDYTFVCRNGSWEVKRDSKPAPSELTLSVKGLVATSQFSLTNGCQGYSLSWGDGTAEDKVAASGQLACTLALRSISRVHTYAKAGTYTVTLNLLQSAGAPKTYTKTVTVAAASVGSRTSTGLFQNH